MGWWKEVLGVQTPGRRDKKALDKALRLEARKQATTNQTAATANQPQALAPAQVQETPQQELALRQQELGQHVQLAKQAQQPGNVAAEEARVKTIHDLQTTPGFRPEQAAAMKHEAYKLAQRQGQMNQRALLGEQSQRGIGGRSGIGYAQQRDVNRGVAAQQAQSLRDFQRLNAEQGTALGAAGYAAGEGEKSRMETDIESEREAERRRKYQLANPPTQQFMKIG